LKWIFRMESSIRGVVTAQCAAEEARSWHRCRYQAFASSRVLNHSGCISSTPTRQSTTSVPNAGSTHTINGVRIRANSVTTLDVWKESTLSILDRCQPWMASIILRIASSDRRPCHCALRPNPALKGMFRVGGFASAPGRRLASMHLAPMQRTDDERTMRGIAGVGVQPTWSPIHWS
jgi:hypothetical protein